MDDPPSLHDELEKYTSGIVGWQYSKLNNSFSSHAFDGPISTRVIEKFLEIAGSSACIGTTMNTILLSAPPLLVAPVASAPAKKRGRFEEMITFEKRQKVDENESKLAVRLRENMERRVSSIFKERDVYLSLMATIGRCLKMKGADGQSLMVGCELLLSPTSTEVPVIQIQIAGGLAASVVDLRDAIGSSLWTAGGLVKLNPRAAHEPEISDLVLQFQTSE